MALKITTIIGKTLLGLLITIAIAEGVLRIIDSNQKSALFVESSDNTDFLILNPSIHTGNVKSKFIQRTKNKDTFRIFLLGESADLNWNINPNTCFPHILNGILQKSCLNKHIEVIDLPLSYSDLLQRSLAGELVEYNPDLVILMPTNEIINLQFFENDWFRNLYVYKILLKLTTENYHATFSNKRNKQLLELETKLDKFVLSLQEQGVRVILINQPTNLQADLSLETNFSSPDSAHLSELFNAGKLAFENEDYDGAYGLFSKIYKKEKSHTGTLYFLGKLALKGNNHQLAKTFLQKAFGRDNNDDCFTATDLNKIIFKTSVIRGCALIDTEKLFSDFSPYEIPGYNFFNSRNNINLAGNVLLARECTRTILKAQDINDSEETVSDELMLTPFDTIYDQLISEKTSQKLNLPDPESTSFEEKLSSLFIENKSTWEDSMNKLFNYYVDKKKYSSALKVIENLALENPYNMSICEKAFKTASLTGDSQLVVHYAKRLYKEKPSLEIAQTIFLNYLKLDMPESALPYLQYAREKTLKTKDLDLIYTATCEIIDLKRILNRNPGNKEIRHQIAYQYKAMGNYEIAALYLR